MHAFIIKSLHGEISLVSGLLMKLGIDCWLPVTFIHIRLTSHTSGHLTWKKQWLEWLPDISLYKMLFLGIFNHNDDGKWQKTKWYDRIRFANYKSSYGFNNLKIQIKSITPENLSKRQGYL